MRILKKKIIISELYFCLIYIFFLIITDVPFHNELYAQRLENIGKNRQAKTIEETTTAKEPYRLEDALRYGLSKSGNAIRIPQNKILLIRHDNKYGALKVIKSGDDFAEYEWYYQNDGTGVFISSTAMRGKGKVFEKYRAVEKTPTSQQVIDKGSELFIKFGEFKLEWSSGNWIYFPDELTEMALTDKEDIRNINATDPRWKFLKKK